MDKSSRAGCAALLEERRRRAAERRRAALDAEIRELFRPTFPPLLPLTWYPARAPGGALVVRAEMVGGAFVEHGLRVVRLVAEDGRSWLECGELAR